MIVCFYRLQFSTVDDVVEIKGRVACEISTGDELLLTEMIFGGAFNDITSHQAVSLLSCFVAGPSKDTMAKKKIKMEEELAGPLRQMQVRQWTQTVHVVVFCEIADSGIVWLHERSLAVSIFDRNFFVIGRRLCLSRCSSFVLKHCGTNNLDDVEWSRRGLRARALVMTPDAIL